MSSDPTPQIGLGVHDRRLLSALDEYGGMTASHVARELGWGSNIRSGMQIVRRELDALCERGLARRLDDLKPTCWLRTPAATEALGRG